MKMNKKGQANGCANQDVENTTESDPRKRTREELSSISEYELGISNQNETTKQNKPKKKKSKKKQEQSETNEEPFDLTDNTSAIKSIMKQLDSINKKLSNVITKDDRYVIDIVEKVVEKKNVQKITAKDEEAIQEIVDKLVEKKINKIKTSFEKRVEVLELQLFEKSEENDKLKQQIDNLNKTIIEKQEKTIDTNTMSKHEATQTKKRMNDLEQYTRINNIRVYGLPDLDEHETPSNTIATFLKEIKNLQLNINETDIDTGHRLGKFHVHKPRPIIIRFMSRLIKDSMMRHKKTLGQRIFFVNDDLTRLNQQVFTSIRLKMQDEIKSVWTRNGRILFRRHDETVTQVEFEDYEHWLELPWPQQNRLH